MRYQAFRFVGYEFSAVDRTLQLHYGYDNALRFTETYRFDFDFVPYDPLALDMALQNLFFIAGVSYYKAFIPGEIRVEAGTIDQPLADFLSKTYRCGLGEFWYVNQLSPHTPVDFPVNADSVKPADTIGKGLLVGLGGGKDSLVSVELLRKTDQTITTWSLGHRAQLAPLVERTGLPHYWVERSWDSQLQTLNEQDAYNGHIPISAIIAAVGTVVCILTGQRDHVVSNEQSANEPTLIYDGAEINHQYSKSQEFERDYQALLRARFGDTQRYYSLLRPLSELRIAELFAENSFTKYHDVFSSCNTAFRRSSNRMLWDGTCAKCAFIFLVLTPFVDRPALETVFGGKNLLRDASLDPTYRQLLGIGGEKPLDCVGEVRESRYAMKLARQHYPGLSRYAFKLDDSYDFRTIHRHEIPDEIWAQVNEFVDSGSSPE
ncbi:MAG: hypothetical protein WBP03_03345 [Candidatus Saccharimonadales bacterium]